MAAGNLNELEIQHGIGPVTQYPDWSVDNDGRTGQGDIRPEVRHLPLSGHKKTGPMLRDVTKRRSPEYVLNQILNPEQMGKLHPDGRSWSRSTRSS